MSASRPGANGSYPRRLANGLTAPDRKVNEVPIVLRLIDWDVEALDQSLIIP